MADNSQLLVKARMWLDNAPDVRYDLVNTIRAQIASGSYEVPVEELAKRLTNVLSAS